jgi:hypothetical protein
VAIADLRKGQPANLMGMHLGTHVGAKRIRFQHASFNDTESASAGPSHALQKSATVDTVIIVVVLDDAVRVWMDELVFRHFRYLQF